MPRHVALLIPLALASVAGCSNPCQDLCLRMADYAEECGFTVPDAEIDACIDDQGSASGDDKDICRENGDAATIRNEWTCEDLALYWGTDATAAE